MGTFETINPANGKIINRFNLESEEEVLSKVDSADYVFERWKKVSIKDKLLKMRVLSDLLKKDYEMFGSLITKEMGKCKKEADAEVMKCASMISTYVKNSEKWLENENVNVDGLRHYISYRPLGIILTIMPWNFPFWQALRFAVPALIVGNTAILKHSNVVPECALAIEKLFLDAGFEQGIFQTIVTDHKVIESVIASPKVKGVSFTGSTSAGKRINELAGKYLKKVVLELGGSDPFIVLKDADIQKAAEGAVLGRFMNAGQSCIAAKRFIVDKGIAGEFTSKLIQILKTKNVGEPDSCLTDIGTLVNADAVKAIEIFVDDAVSKGAEVLYKHTNLPIVGAYFPPTILSNLNKSMKLYFEEVFGPVAPIYVFDSENEAIEIANCTEFGLGGSVWTKDINKGVELADQIESGTVFVNSIVKSDARMPFGGIKQSGIGRELSKFGLYEFCNIKGNNIYDC